MGVYLNLKIAPKRISPSRWESVYEEALQIIDRFEFMDRICLQRNGLNYPVARKSAERNLFGKGLGVYICGTMVSGFDMEDFTLHRNLEYYQKWVKSEEDDGVDIIFANYYPESDNDEIIIPDCVCNVWGGKTQGCLGHIPLLGIACLFADRFPDAVIVSGDITAGQCRSAVQFANKFLESPIDIPVICRPKDLAQRIRKNTLSVQQKLGVFFRLYLGSLTDEVGTVLTEVFSREKLYLYFREELSQESFGKYDFSQILRNYLMLGLDFSDLLKMLITDPEGHQLSLEAVLTELFSYKIYVPLEGKNTYNPGDLSNAVRGEDTTPYDISTMLGSAFFQMFVGKNRNFPVYVPLETIKNACRSLGEDTDMLINRLLAEQAIDERQEKTYGNGSDSLVSMICKKADQIQAENQDHQKYDIGELQDIYYYKPGNTIEPGLEDRLVNSIRQIQAFELEDDFKGFLSLDRTEREKYFIKQNRYILIHEDIWNYIFEHIMDDIYIRRFFFLSRVDCSRQNTHDLMEPLLSSPALIDLLWVKASEIPAQT